MNFFKKVASVVVSLPMIFSQASAYDYFMHSVKKDIKCERCGKLAPEKKLRWEEMDANGNIHLVKEETFHKVYCVPACGNKVLCPHCMHYARAEEIEFLLCNHLPVYDAKKLEELKSDPAIKSKWPMCFDCGPRSLTDGNETQVECSVCYDNVNLRSPGYYRCEYCADIVCERCGLAVENSKNSKETNTNMTMFSYAKGDIEYRVKCPKCRYGMFHYKSPTRFDEEIKILLDILIKKGRGEYEKRFKRVIVKPFVDAVLQNAKISNKNKIYV